MSAAALRKIEAELVSWACDLDEEGHQDEAYRARMTARKVAAQAEMLELELDA